jgi:hypothetical protein
MVRFHPQPKTKFQLHITKESINKLQECIKIKENLQRKDVLGENHPRTLN